MNCAKHPDRPSGHRVRLPGSPLLQPLCEPCYEEFVIARYPRSGRTAELLRRRAGKERSR
jgi:hypothetical protein